MAGYLWLLSRLLLLASPWLNPVLSSVMHDMAACGTLPPPAHALDRERRLKESRTRHRRRQQVRDALCRQCIEIETVFHIIRPTGGNSSKTVSYINDQMTLLNQNYGTTPFRFKHKGTTQTVNNVWVKQNVFDMSNNQEKIASDIAAKLRVGGPDVANVFVVEGSACPTLGGFASIPYEKGMFPPGTYSKTDYIFICPTFVDFWSSNPSPQYPLLSHEMGHWLGLLHVFESGGDLVDDTPVQLGPSFFCKDGEKDNMMDISSCIGTFTAGQIERMYETFREYRRPSDRCNNDETQVYLEVLLNDRPQDVQIGFADWGGNGGSSSMDLMPYLKSESQIDFAHQLLSRQICMPTLTLHYFLFDGLKEDDIYLEMNYQSLIQSAEKSTEKRLLVWMAGDAFVCPSRSRIELDLNFNLNPSSVLWELTDATSDSDLMDYLDTVAFAAKGYTNDMAFTTLFVDKCVKPGKFMFSIWDDRNQPLTTTYRLAVDGQEIPIGLTPVPRNGFMKEITLFTVDPLDPSELTEPNLLSGSQPVYCFSGKSTVQVQHRLHRTSMDNLQIGDIVHIGNGVYETVYAFGHRSPEGRAEFLRVLTNGTISNGKLVMSPDHMVFLAEGGPPVPAGLLHVGSSILDLEGNKLSVLSISKVTSLGQYAPFTPSGILEVDGVLVSTFVALEQSPSLSLFAGVVSLSFQWLSHSFEFPHRVACHYTGPCLEEHYVFPEGKSEWSFRPHQFAMWLLQQSPMMRSVGLGMILVFLIIFNVLEWLILNRYFVVQIMGVSLLCSLLSHLQRKTINC